MAAVQAALVADTPDRSVPGQTLKQNLNELIALFGLIILKHADETPVNKGAVADTSLINPLEVAGDTNRLLSSLESITTKMTARYIH
jgi:hypothetical protein